jgi:hypothetical protein
VIRRQHLSNRRPSMNPQYTVDPPYPTGEGLYGECAAKFKIALSIVTVFTYLEKVINHEETKRTKKEVEVQSVQLFMPFFSSFSSFLRGFIFILPGKSNKPRRDEENEERGRSSISSTFYAFSSLRSLRFFVVSFS